MLLNLLVLLISGLLNYVVTEKNVFCYYGTWATYRYGLGKFDVGNIDPTLCTHLMYAFAGINNDGTVATLDPYLDLPDNWGRDNFGAFNSLKEGNPHLKTILAVGGWNEGSAKYSTMAASATLRQAFVNSAISMVLQYGFDGLDLDWEYPNRRDSVNGQADVDNFTQLTKELREACDKHGLFLSAAVSSVKNMASLSYDVSGIAQYLDIIGLMTYDMNGAWDPVTGHNAPLHSTDDDIIEVEAYTVDAALKYWLDQGCPPEKLVLGLPFYGHTFILNDANINAVGAPSSGPGFAGPYTATSGTVGYNEFCVDLQSGFWDVRYDETGKVPYAVQGQNWVSYDDADSLTLKIEYGLSLNIAGIMVWSIETDDFNGLCGEEFPLLKAINRALGKLDTGTSTTQSATSSTPSTQAGSSSTESTEASSTTLSSTASLSSTTTTTSASTPDPSSVCQKEGFTANPRDCTSFFYCYGGEEGPLTAAQFQCPANLYWDQTNLLCNYADLVNCQVK